MSATASVFETADNTSGFLSDLLGSIEMGKGPEKTIADLNLKILTNVVSFIPLRERMNLSFVSQQFNGAVRASITSLNFYRDCLDCLPDHQVKEMLQQYGNQITSLNFDLFKSTFDQETSQWMWRQTVLAFSSLCPNLTELSILICNRHRLRDKDLVTIFEKCPHLTKLCVDAQFLNGHCFKKAPMSLTHVEMEMCYRISDLSLRTMFSRFRKMKTLHVSQLLTLTDAHISLLVRSFRNLQELSIVSHVDTKYDQLSGAGLGELGKLSKLRVLCLEGLGAVTDRTLTVISDPHLSPTSSTITALSLAFCYNVSQHGLKHLGRLTSLVDLNIDGITKRDVSMGVERIAAEGRLVRLFVAERTNLSPEALVAVVSSCPNLRLLDISNNEECFNWVTAEKMMFVWCQPSSSSPPARRAPLTILTDEHLAWNCAGAPAADAYGRTPLLVVHINRGAVPEDEVLPTSALSTVRPSELPPGLLAPHIRRGNRYRLLWAPLGPSKELLFESASRAAGEAGENDSENGAASAELALRTAQAAEEKEAIESSDSDVSSSYSMEGVECGLFGGGAGSDAAAAAAAGGGLPWATAGNEENLPPLSAPVHKLPPDFSMTPISEEGDPHTKDWSMDVMSLLLKTYAYEDGAMVGPMTVKEGIIMRPDGSVEDICSSILKVDASLRARYHMTAALNGTRRCGPHAHNTRDAMRLPPTDPVMSDIASAIDDFLGGYVPEDPQSAGHAAAESSSQHMQQQQHRPTKRDPLSPYPPSAFNATTANYDAAERGAAGGVEDYFLMRPLDDSSASLPYGHCENEAPAGYNAGRRGGYGAPRYDEHRTQQHHHRDGREQLHTLQPLLPLQQKHLKHYRTNRENTGGAEPMLGLSRLSTASSISSLASDAPPRPRLSSMTASAAPFVPRHLREGLASAPAATVASEAGSSCSSTSAFPFPPPAAYFNDNSCSSGGGSGSYPVQRPYGRQRGGAAGIAAQPGSSAAGWPDPAKGPHPYARHGVLKPRN